MMYHIESFKTTINSVAAAAQQGAAYFLVLPSTLVHPNYAHAWLALAAQAENDTTAAAFDATLMLFIAEFFTLADRVLLAHEIRNSRLPRDMRVTDFARAIQHNNNRIVSLPGTEPKLTEDQIKVALYNAMPLGWQVNWNNNHLGNIHEAELSSIVGYFSHQQLQSISYRNNIETLRSP